MLERGMALLLVVACASSCSRDIATGERCADACEGPSAGSSPDAALGPIASDEQPSLAGQGAEPDARGSLGELEVTLRDGHGGSGDALRATCGGSCIELEAVAEGGNPPYTFVWNDGTEGPTRQICPAVDELITVSVVVSDTAVETQEFAHTMQMVTAAGIVSRSDCDDDAGAESTGMTCDLGDGRVLPEELTVDVPGATIRYFAGGNALAPGRYRLEYVDGCNTFGVGCGWTVHAADTNPGVMSCFLVSGTAVFGLTPGTVGVFPGNDPMTGGAFDTYAACVDANRNARPLDFTFEGGQLGVARDGGGVLGAVDDGIGESEGGRSPTFRLSRLEACP
jgi:hypothetical protein